MGDLRTIEAGTGGEPSANEGALADQSRTTGYIYFIRAGRTPWVKIGWALDPEKRLGELQTGNPHKLHLIGYLPGTQRDETGWHYRHAHNGRRGEWFPLTVELREAINGLAVRDCGFVRYLHLSIMGKRQGQRGANRIAPTYSW